MSEDTIAERISEKVKKAAHFEPMLRAFEDEFGSARVQFELFYYDSFIGIAVANKADTCAGYARIAFRFGRNDDMSLVRDAIGFTRRWARGDTKFKGIEGDNILEGMEMRPWDFPA
jgi:hypothetical protein